MEVSPRKAARRETAYCGSREEGRGFGARRRHAAFWRRPDSNKRATLWSAGRIAWEELCRSCVELRHQDLQNETDRGSAEASHQRRRVLVYSALRASTLESDRRRRKQLGGSEGVAQVMMR